MSGQGIREHKKLMNEDTKLIITTPNVFNYHNLATILLGVEKVHPDHKFWLSAKTLRSLIESVGLEIIKLEYCRTGHSSEYPVRSKIF